MAQAITTKYAGPTNTRGSRIIVTSWMGRTVWNYDHALDSGKNHEQALLAHIGTIEKKAHAAGHIGVSYRIVGYAPDYWQWMGATPKGDGYVAVII